MGMFDDLIPAQQSTRGAAPPPAPGMFDDLLPEGSSPSGAGPSSPAPAADPSSGGSDQPRPLTVHVGRPAAPSVPASPSPAQPPPVPGWISLKDATTPETPNPGGVLSNASDDGYLSGAAKGLGTAAIKAAGNTIGFVGGLGNLADYLVARGENVVTGQPVADILADIQQQRQRQEAADPILKWSDPRTVLPAPADVSGPILRQTGEYVPTSMPGRMAQAGAEAVLSSVGPGVGAKAAPLASVLGGAARAAPVVAASGAAAQGATEVTGDPLAGLLAGTVVGPAAEMGWAGAKKAIMPMAAATPGVRGLGPVAAWADNQAAGQLAQSFSTPAAARDWAAQPPAPDLVSGSPNTLAATVGTDPRLFQAEKAARSIDNTAFNAVDARKSAAQQAALGAIAPGADLSSPGQMLSARMDAIDNAAEDAIDRLNAAHQEAVSRTTAAGQAFADQQQAGLAERTAVRTQAAIDARAQGQAGRQQTEDRLVQSFRDAHDQQLAVAQTAAAPLGDRADEATLGGTLRNATAEVRAGAKDLHRSLYNAVDPDGTLALVATPVREAATGIVDRLRSVQGELDSSEAPLFSRAQTLPDVASYGAVHQLDQDITAAMARERRTAGETPTLARLTQLKGAVKGAIVDAADNQVAHEARLVAAGQMSPDDAMVGRLRDAWGVGHADAAASTPARAGSNAADLPGAQTALGAGIGRAGDAAAGRSGQAPSDPGLPEAPLHDDTAVTQRPISPGTPRPRDLMQFIRDHGGLQDPGGDLTSMGLGRLRGFIAKPGQGLSPDRMREAAAEAGYLGADIDHAMQHSTIGDLMDAVESTNPVHSVYDGDAVHAWDVYDQQRAAYDRVSGPTSRSAAPPRAPLSAYRQEDAYPAGMAPLDDAAAPTLRPNLMEADANRLKAANAAYAEYTRTFKNPIVGPGLRTTGFAGQYQRSYAAFIKGAVRPGPDGYEAARAHLAAAANDPAAIDAMHEAALNPLRKMVTGNGTIPATGLARWKETFGPALRALDEVSPGFSSRFDTAAHATDALVDLGRQQRQALEEHQDAAAMAAIQERQQIAADLKAGTAADRTTTGRAIADQRASDAAVIAQSRGDTSAGLARVRGIRQDAAASPAGRYATAAAGKGPEELENLVGGLLKTGTGGATTMRGLVQSVAANPDALEGLRRGAAGWMARSFMGTDGEMMGGKLIRFLRDNGATLRELYDPKTLDTMMALGRDAEVGAKWRTETAIKGGSDTAKNLIAMAGKAGEAAKHLSLLMVAGEAILQGWDHAGLHGAVMGGSTAGLAYMANALRSAGLHRVSDLYREALADPELARTLLSRMPQTADSPVLHGLARILKRSLIVAPIVEQRTAT